MISLGGRYLPCPTPDVQAWVSKYIDVRDVLQFDPTAQNHNLYHLAPPSDVSVPPIKIGSFYWPSGASRFAVGYFIGDTSDVDYLNPIAFTATGIQGMYLILDERRTAGEDIEAVVSTAVFMLPPRPLAGFPGTNNLYLITVVDQRYFAWFKRGSYVISGMTTWSSLTTSVLSDIQATFTISTPAADWGVPSNRFTVHDQPVPLYADSMAFYSGNRIARQLDGTLTCVNDIVTAAQDAVNIAKVNSPTGVWYPKRLSGGGFNATTIRRFLPKELTVVFGRTDFDVFSQTPWTKTFSITTLVADDVLDGFADVTGFNGTKVLTGDLTAEFTGGPDPDNLADLEAYAETMAASWYAWAVTGLDIAFSGIVPWNPSANDYMIEWAYRSDMVRTRIQREPFTEMDWGRFRRSSLEGERSWIIDQIYPTNCDQVIECIEADGETPLTYVEQVCAPPKTLKFTGVPDGMDILVDDVSILTAGEGSVEIVDSVRFQTRTATLPISIVAISDPAECRDALLTECCSDEDYVSVTGCCAGVLYPKDIQLTFVEVERIPTEPQVFACQSLEGETCDMTWDAGNNWWIGTLSITGLGDNPASFTFTIKITCVTGVFRWSWSVNIPCGDPNTFGPWEFDGCDMADWHGTFRADSCCQGDVTIVVTPNI